MNIEVTHLTRLEYTDDVVEAVMDARLGPLDDADQVVEQFELRTDPLGNVRRYQDGLGNVAHLITHPRPHRYLELTASSRVRTLLSDPFALPATPPAPLDPVALADGLNPSPLVPRYEPVDAMARPFRPQHLSDGFGAVQGLMGTIYREFTYQKDVTDVGTTISETVANRHGVCQDFAHLLIGLCRSIGIPARYVSGYLVTGARAQTQRQSGQWQSQSQSQSWSESERERQSPIHRGLGASHAWVEAYTPTHGWRGFDPTNNLLANEFYVKVAVGRDYRDVPPTRGTFHGSGREHLSVAVSTRLAQ